MYTRCPECATIFRVTAEQLRMAHGEVRCGNCSTSFNALLSLMDERPAAEQPAEPAAPQTLAETSDDNLEFDAPEQTWSRFFMSPEDAPPRAPMPALGQVSTETEADEPREPIDAQTGEHEEWRGMLDEIENDEAAALQAEPVEDVMDGEDDEPTNEHPIISVEGFADGEDESEPESDVAQQAQDDPHWVLEGVAEEVVVLSGDDQSPSDIVDPAAPITQFHYGDYVENVVLEGDGGIDDAIEEDEGSLPPWITPERLEEAFPQPIEKPSRRWYTAAIALTLVLGLQLVHVNRDALAAHRSLGTTIRAVYGVFDAPLFPEWDLDSFEVTGSDAVAGRSAPEALDVLAEVSVRSAQPVGLPLVRVVLRDRWSNPVANRVFQPAEYAGDSRNPNAIVLPGETIPIEITVDDPGSDALGYLVDICLPHRTAGLKCQLARDPFAP